MRVDWNKKTLSKKSAQADPEMSYDTEKKESLEHN